MKSEDSALEICARSCDVAIHRHGGGFPVKRHPVQCRRVRRLRELVDKGTATEPCDIVNCFFPTLVRVDAKVRQTA